jgi:hypothetical protein
MVRHMFHSGAAVLIGVLLFAGPAVTRAQADSAADSAGASNYGANASARDLGLGAQLGAGSQWQSQFPASSVPGASFGFTGGARLGCSGVDFHAFLRSFDPGELLAELRDSLLSGAQSAASNYLIALAYSNPTISSVLDMMDKKYTARFSAFAQTCDAQAARSRGQDAGARAMAEAGDQCFDQELARGTAPTEAYRRCSIEHTFDGLNLPAAASTEDFLRRFTHVDVTQETLALLALLPDQRIAGGNLQMRPAQLTMASMADRLHNQARAALDRIDAGAKPESIAACGPGALLAATPDPNGCLPANAAALVSSGAFQSARLLGSASRNLFKDALATQLAVSALYASVLELYQQASRIDVRAMDGADAAHAQARRQRLQDQIAQLLLEADTQAKAQAAKAQVVRSQMLALEQVEADFDARGASARTEPKAPQFTMRGLLQLFADRD